MKIWDSIVYIIKTSNCSENLIKAMADRMAADGYKEAGYEYIIIDDCWLAHERTKAGQLQPDPDRFPSGIKNLADYVSTFLTITQINEKLPSPVKGLPICSSLWMLQETHLY